jgi:hypothetical protein
VRGIDLPDRLTVHDTLRRLLMHLDERRVKRGSNRFLTLANGLPFLPLAFLTTRLEAPDTKGSGRRIWLSPPNGSTTWFPA